MRQLIIYLFCTCTIINIIAQSSTNDTIITVNLESKTDFYRFAHLPKICKNNRIEFKGIPIGLDTTNSVIKSLLLYKDPFVLDTLFTLIGDLSEHQRICIVDANYNKDFSDDYQYVFNKAKVTKETIFPAQPLLIRYYKDSVITKKMIYVNPFFKGSGSITIKKEQDYYVYLSTPEYKIGNFEIEGKCYSVILPLEQVELDNYLIMDSTKFCKAHQKYLLGMNLRPITDKFMIAGYLVHLKEIGALNSTLTLKITSLNSLNKEQKRGYDEGFYAPNIQNTDINGKDFNMEQYKGGYILIDFWGTWCNPCIALLPHIAELHIKYPKLKIISIATDETKESVTNIPYFIKKYQMNWVNICDFGLNYWKKPYVNYKVSSFPTTILINPEGKIIHRGGTQEIPALNIKLEEIFKSK